MNKILFAITLFLSCQLVVQAQAPERSRGQSTYVEIFGNGLVYSLNYDTRFNPGMNGIGGRAGLGYLAIDGVRITTVPILVNYLFGHDRHFFEVGAGVTIMAGSVGSRIGPVGDRSRSSSVIGTMSMGYRLEPTDGGFLFRAGLTPFFGSGYFWPLWPQVSFGYAF